MPGAAVEVVEFTDPGCSWAWGSEPKFRLLRWRHGGRLCWRRVMGGLVGDMRNYIEAFDPVAAAPGFSAYWARVAAATGMPFPARLGRMYRSTEPACRAVKAAELQGPELADRVLRRLREQTFVFGEPADDLERIAAAVADVPDLDVARLIAEWRSPQVAAAFTGDWVETRAPNAYVRSLEDEGEGGGRAKQTEGHWRYVFPTVVFRGPAGERTVPGWKPYERYEEALEAVTPGATRDPRPDPTLAEAFAAWPALAEKELGVLCGAGARPPANIVAFDAGGGTYWLTAAEARARGLCGR